MNQRMKTIDRIAILCALVLAASCGGKVDPVDPDPNKDEPVAETRTLTFVLPDLVLEEGEEAPVGVKTAWEAGDQIVVHGEYAKNQVTVTLAAGDISADGKSATKTVEGLYPYKREDCASTLYASYPASAVDNLKHCFFYSKFSTTNAPIMAACNSGDSFQFQRIYGVLSMTLDGDYSAFELKTSMKEPVGLEFLQVKITDKANELSQYVGDAIIELAGPVQGNQLLVYLPAGTTFSHGFQLKLKETGKDDFTRIYRTSTPMTFGLGKSIDLGDISAEIKAYENPFSADVKDLDVNGNANCYILTEPGKYKFKAVYGNNLKRYLTGVDAGSVVWETWNTTETEGVAGSIVTSVSYAEDYMLLTTAETLHAGNALIAAVDAEGTILWSWHLWVPATPITDCDASLGAAAMDRNLGALKATVDTEPVDQQSFGLFYQWGRKDPFPGNKGAAENGDFALVGTQMVKQNTPITTEESIAKPYVYACNKSGNEGYNWNVASIADAWGGLGDKTIYDPCPAGYRVPAGDGAAWSKTGGWVFNLAQGWFKIGNVVFPYCGYMDDNGGGYSKAGERSVIWTAQADATEFDGILCNGRAAYIKSATYDGSTARQARGATVRCVAE